MASSKRVTSRKVVATADKLARTENNRMAAGKSQKQVEKKIASVMVKGEGRDTRTNRKVIDKVGRVGEPNKKSGTPKPVRKEASKLMKASRAQDKATGKAMASKSPALMSKAAKLQGKAGTMAQKATPAGLKKAQAMDAKEGMKTFNKAMSSKKSPSFKKK